MERIGIFGGSFNPPHIGHIRAAEYAVSALGLTRLLVIPTGLAPHKTQNLPARQRMDMLRLAFSGLPQAEISDMEITRPGISYTWQTVEELKKAYPESQMYLLLGTDMFSVFPDWKRADYLCENLIPVVLSRGERGEQKKLEEARPLVNALGAEPIILNNTPCPISSTQLRRLLAFGCADAFLPEQVSDYIYANGLYHTNACWKQLPMEQLEGVVVSLLNPNRVAHVIGCRDTAVELARHWGADETDAARAGILHDITKALDGPLQLTLCDAYGKILSDFSKKYPKTLHALTGSLVAQRVFGENEAVVDAICWHTTGKADMNLLEMIIYVADYMEPNRNFPGVEKLRELAYSDIREALKLGLEMTLVHLSTQGSEVSPESREALAFLNQK